MKAKRRRRSAAGPDLFADGGGPKQPAQRIADAGNYATRTIRRWILADPAAVAVCRQLASSVRTDESRRRELGKRLAAWFASEVHLEEPSAAYADYLTGSTEAEWGMLADELLADAWPEGPKRNAPALGAGAFFAPGRRNPRPLALSARLLQHGPLTGFRPQGSS